MGLHDQFKFEVEGAAAGLQGKTRDDCPYDSGTQSFEWNHWVFGCEIAASEKATIERGEVFFCSTDIGSFNPNPPKGSGIPVRDAIERGLWKPRYATIKPSSDTGSGN